MAKEHGPTGDTTHDGENNPPPSHPKPKPIGSVEPIDVVHPDPEGLATFDDT